MDRGLRPVAPLLAFTLLGASSQAHEQAQQQPATAVVRVSLSLVQVDAIVTDKAGRHITDLLAADFQRNPGDRLRDPGVGGGSVGRRAA